MGWVETATRMDGRAAKVGHQHQNMALIRKLFHGVISAATLSRFMLQFTQYSHVTELRHTAIRHASDQLPLKRTRLDSSRISQQMDLALPPELT